MIRHADWDYLQAAALVAEVELVVRQEVMMMMEVVVVMMQ